MQWFNRCWLWLPHSPRARNSQKSTEKPYPLPQHPTLIQLPVFPAPLTCPPHLILTPFHSSPSPPAAAQVLCNLFSVHPEVQGDKTFPRAPDLLACLWGRNIISLHLHVLGKLNVTAHQALSSVFHTSLHSRISIGKHQFLLYYWNHWSKLEIRGHWC